MAGRTRNWAACHVLTVEAGGDDRQTPMSASHGPVVWLLMQQLQHLERGQRQVVLGLQPPLDTVPQLDLQRDQLPVQQLQVGIGHHSTSVELSAINSYL
ncbi:hypothetical protein [Streptomyces canus]|uniref:hypothetical protein n=1 Tax=Streptomyces canus TaxID=58343 RepID=UPI0037F37966